MSTYRNSLNIMYTMYVLEDKTVTEIAEEMGYTESYVQKMLNKNGINKDSKDEYKLAKRQREKEKSKTKKYRKMSKEEIRECLKGES